MKAKAKEQGLWNFFLPNAETREGLSNLDYAYIAGARRPTVQVCGWAVVRT